MVILFFGKVLFYFTKKYKIYEIPVDLPFRKLGSSKMKISDIINSLVFLCYYFFKRFFIRN